MRIILCLHVFHHPSDKKQEQPTHFKEELISWMNESMGDNKNKTMDENWQHNKLVIDYIQSHMIHMDDSH
jgi:hypothetical protein